MNGFIDIHHHLIWGMDDGPSTFKKTAAMMHAASKDGVSIIIATPHASPGIKEFNLRVYLQRVRLLNKYSNERNLGVTVLPGSEILYTQYTAQLLREKRIPTLAYSEYALVEFEPGDSYEHIYDALRSLSNHGFTPVVAHVERYKCLVKNAGLIKELKSTFHARMQVNCSTIINGRSRQVRKFVSDMLDSNLLDFVATDSHNTSSRPTRMHDCYDILLDSYGKRMAARLTCRNQEAIIADIKEELIIKPSEKIG